MSSATESPHGVTEVVESDPPEQANPPDRRSLLKKAGMLLGGATALAALGTPAEAASDDSGADAIVGLWAGTVSAPDNSYPPFHVIDVFGGGGTYTGSGQLDLTPGALSSTAWGVWQRVGNRAFRYTFRFWTYDPNANPTGYADTVFTSTVSKDGKSYHGEGLTQLRDVNGNPIGPPFASFDDATRLA